MIICKMPQKILYILSKFATYAKYFCVFSYEVYEGMRLLKLIVWYNDITVHQNIMRLVGTLLLIAEVFMWPK